MSVLTTPPDGTTHVRVRVGRELVTFVLDEDHLVEALVRGEPAKQGAALLASLGSAPAWWDMLVKVETVAARCADVPLVDVIRFMGRSELHRKRLVAEQVDPVPQWLGWACAFDDSAAVRRAWLQRFPVDGSADAAVSEMVSLWERGTVPGLRERFRSDEGARQWAMRSTISMVVTALVEVHGRYDTRLIDERGLVEMARRHKNDEQVSLALLRNAQSEEMTLELCGSPFLSVRDEMFDKHASWEVLRRLQDDPVHRIAARAFLREQADRWTHEHQSRSGPEYEGHIARWNAHAATKD